LTFSIRLCRISKICKDNEEKKQIGISRSEREAVKALGWMICVPFLPLPGMTGTGAPVTEYPRDPVSG